MGRVVGIDRPIRFSLGESIGTAGGYVDLDLEAVRAFGAADLSFGVRNVLGHDVHDHPLSWCQGREVFVGLATGC
jgi:hypothetical protein